MYLKLMLQAVGKLSACVILRTRGTKNLLSTDAMRFFILPVDRQVQNDRNIEHYL